MPTITTALRTSKRGFIDKDRGGRELFGSFIEHADAQISPVAFGNDAPALTTRTQVVALFENNEFVSTTHKII
jgi:hypothetical protein